MRIGVFCDDSAGTAVALLVARGLACIGECVDVVVETGGGRPALPESNVSGLHVANVSPDAVANAMGAPPLRQRHLVVARALHALSDEGETVPFEAALTVGRDHPASARALRAARYTVDDHHACAADAAHLPLPPAWFVPCSHQVDLWTKATLASTGAVKLPFATRTIPFMVPRFDPEGVAQLARVDAEPPALRTAVLLASVVTAIAADPFARRIDAASMAALMTDQKTEAGEGIGHRLLALAAEYERLDASLTCEASQRRPQPTDRRRPGSSIPPSPLRRRHADPARGRTRQVVR